MRSFLRTVDLLFAGLDHKGEILSMETVSVTLLLLAIKLSVSMPEKMRRSVPAKDSDCEKFTIPVIWSMVALMLLFPVEL